MDEGVTLTTEQVRGILDVIHGIGELIKALPSEPKHNMTTYAIMSNLMAIQMTLNPNLRANQN